MTASDRAHDWKLGTDNRDSRLRWLIAAKHFQLCFARLAPPTEELRRAVVGDRLGYGARGQLPLDLRHG